MLLPSLVQVSESISGSVVPLAMFECDPGEWWYLKKTFQVIDYAYWFTYLAYLPNQRTDQLTGVGAEDAYASKKVT